jgi:hypothetical protein
MALQAAMWHRRPTQVSPVNCLKNASRHVTAKMLELLGVLLACCLHACIAVHARSPLQVRPSKTRRTTLQAMCMHTQV